MFALNDLIAGVGVSLFPTFLFPFPLHLYFSPPLGAPRLLCPPPFAVLVLCSHMFATRRSLSFPTVSLLPLLRIISVIALDCFATNGWGSLLRLKRTRAWVVLIRK